MPWILLFLDVLPRAVAAIWQAVLGSQQKRDSQGKEQKRKSVLWWHYWAMDWPDVGLCPAVNSGYGWRYMSCFWADSSQGSSIVCSWKHPSSMCCQSVTHIPKQECTHFSEKYGELLIYGLHSDHEIGSRRMCLISEQIMKKHLTCTWLGLKATFPQDFISLLFICLSIRQDSVPFPHFLGS